MRLIKKVLSLTASAFIVLIASGFLSLQPIAQSPALAQGSQPECNLLSAVRSKTGTDPVLSPGTTGRKSGVADSGQLRFDVVDSAYRGCITADTDTRGAVSSAHFFDGWAWNTNLGYVSFSCQSGKNLDVECGATDYGAYYTKPGAGQDSSVINGFIYNDNMGWVSMSCTGGFNDGVDCGSTTYGVSIVNNSGVISACSGAATFLNEGDLYGYAWSDSVGWINFCGAHVANSGAKEQITPPVISIDTSTVLNPATNVENGVVYANGVTLPNGVAYANGVAYHEITIGIDENGTPVEENPDRSVAITTTWNDTIRTDQITACGGPDPACKYNGTNLRHTPPTNSSATSDPVWDPTRKIFVLQVKSIAPTGSQDSLQLTGLDIIIKDTATGNIIQSFAYDSTSPELQNKFFKFAPAVAATKIEGQNSSGVYTSGVISIADVGNTNVRITRESYLAGMAKLTTELYDCSSDYQFDFRPAGSAPDSNSPIVPNMCSTGTPGGIKSYNINNINANAPSGAISKVITTAAQGTGAVSNVDTSGAVQLQTLVNYTFTPSWGGGSQDVQYFSLRTTDGSVVGQAADVRGNVRIDIRDLRGLPAGDRISASIGDKAQSKRTPFLIAKTATIKSADALQLDSDASNKPSFKNISAAALNNATATKGILYYKREKTQPSPLPCSIILSDTSLISFTPNVTLVTEGCDVFIDQNIMATPASAGSPAKSGRLGIIALQDMTMRSARKGGNVYICSAVTDIEANIVADGSIFSYGESQNQCGGTDKNLLVDGTTGYPVFTSPLRNILINQLTITGSLVSNNTYGGSVAEKPTLGNGKLAASADEARWYDINFWRYAKTIIVNGGKCWAPDVIGSMSIDKNFIKPTDCNNNTPDAGISIVNVRYRGPEGAGLPIFNTVKAR